jgi:RNA polymerase sigma-70 factor (ECF subfamily)
LDTNALIDHLFRHRAGQMVATLTRVFGPEHLPLAEEVVQEALIAAMQQWSFGSIPENPAGWLFRVARNRALDQLRRNAMLREKEPALAAALSDSVDPDEPALAHELVDDQLRMMLLCCHPAIPEESRIVLTLKTVGGFSVDEIARAFLAQSSAIAQRLVRAKRLIRDEKLTFDFPPRAELAPRVESLMTVLYLMFNEGYAATAGDELVRADICHEAIRLTRQLVDHPATTSPTTHALLALMLLQAARLPARTDAAGELALLADQDRDAWNRVMLEEGLHQLEAAADGDTVTTYHIEAAIAATHAIASSFDETDWPQIVSLYDELLATRPSPVVALNRAIAVAMRDGAAAGIAEVERIADAARLRDYPPLALTLGELWLRAGDRTRAAEHFTRALELPASLPEKRFVLRKLSECRT